MRDHVSGYQQERLELLEAVKDIGALIEQTHETAAIIRYIDQLNELKARLVEIQSLPKAVRKLPCVLCGRSATRQNQLLGSAIQPRRCVSLLG